MRLSHLLIGCACIVLYAVGLSQAAGQTPSASPQPVYFYISHHQEAVGSSYADFPNFDRFKQNLRHEMELLDRYGVVSDQYFSDFIVSVVLYMRDSGRDPNAEDVFRYFNQSCQILGYHFHPTTWTATDPEVLIRLDKIKDLPFDQAVMEYAKWERAYYDWSGCTGHSGSGDGTSFCGSLDPNRLGGAQLMEQYFTKPVQAECLTIWNAPVGQHWRQRYGDSVVGWIGNPHSYYSTGNAQYLWQSDWTFSPEPHVYVYRMMGLYFVKTWSNAWAERLAPVSQIKQSLAALPRDVPHVFHIHLTIPGEDHDPLEDTLDYLTKEFIPANPGSRFISSVDMPSLVVANPRTFTMADLDEGAAYLLQNWHGRPPAFIQYSGGYMSLASLFKALQAAMQSYLTGMGLRTWPASVIVADYIKPPLGFEPDLAADARLWQPISIAAMQAAVQTLAQDDAIPYTVAIPPTGGDLSTPIQANAAEFLNGLCTLFARLRQGDTLGTLHVTPGYIIPLSNVPIEATGQQGQTKTNLDWTNELQLWTLEPAPLKDPATGSVMP
ncbi:MAG: hypothetical protein JW955_06075 [Sedimentisphaerales bacterium]|nr:hypothetical protein [Sedimentisphaerales bacterium]